MTTFKKMQEDARNLDKKKLLQEIKEINWHIKHYSYGRFELLWRQALFEESDRRENEETRI